MTHSILLVLGTFVLGYLIGAIVQRRADVKEEERLTDNFYEAQRLMTEAQDEAAKWANMHAEAHLMIGIVSRQCDARMAERDTLERLAFAIVEDVKANRIPVRTPSVINLLKHFEL